MKAVLKLLQMFASTITKSPLKGQSRCETGAELALLPMIKPSKGYSLNRKATTQNVVKRPKMKGTTKMEHIIDTTTIDR